MTINDGVKFIYANEYSDIYGVQMCTSIGSVSRMGNSENRSIITTKNALSNIFNFHGVKYDNPLQFDIIIYNTDGSWIDSYKERQLKKWLSKNKRYWLQVEQDDLSDIQFFCIATSTELIDVGAYSGAMKVTFEADAPWAWSGLRKKTYTCTSTLSANLFMELDFDEYCIYPIMQIKSLGTGTVKIQNTTTNETVEITNCVVNEQIIIENETDKITSSNSNIITRWNKRTMSLVEGKNNITLTGNFQLTMSYRLPIRVGA